MRPCKRGGASSDTTRSKDAILAICLVEKSICLMYLNDLSAGTRNAVTYRVFGLTVVSELTLPELPLAHGNADVCIRYGKVPLDLDNVLFRQENCQVGPSQLLLNVPAAGRFHIENGKNITVEPAAAADEKTVRLFLLGTAFGALLMQRGILPIHGSAIALDGRGIIFTGASGVGKSSLLAAFRQQGAQFLTDDVAAISLDVDGTPWLNPAYPQQKLWRDSAEAMGLSLDGYARVLPEMDKYALPSAAGFSSTAVPLVAICELQPTPRADVSIHPLDNGDTLSVLILNTYRPWLVRGLGLKAQHFRQCAELCARIRGLRLVRGAGTFSLAEQVRVVRAQMDIA